MRTLLFPAVLLLAACGSPTPDTQETSPPATGGNAVVADTAHNSRNALDWPGTYTGTLPCADCDGIRTTVTLHDDGTFDRELVYLGKSDSPFLQTGQFSWNAAGSAVSLALDDGTAQMYQVGENQLFQLDQAGKRISGDLAAQYVLRQSVHDPRIEDRKWRLVEVMGQPFEPSVGGAEAFILLESSQSRASGNNSCNKFFGGYVIEAGQRIRFAANMGATMMACPDIATEASFMEALRKADNYAVKDKQLSLNRARMAPLLRFELTAEPG